MTPSITTLFPSPVEVDVDVKTWIEGGILARFRLVGFDAFR